MNEYLDFFGLFLFVAGFVVGLGAVTVIDIHGFLGRKSPYWTEATTRTHKVTKPLIWLGISLAILGGILFYRSNPTSIFATLHLGAAMLLILNGLFLSFSVSPFLLKRERDGASKELLSVSWQRKIMFSLIVSDLLWWGSLVLLVYYLVTTW